MQLARLATVACHLLLMCHLVVPAFASVWPASLWQQCCYAFPGQAVVNHSAVMVAELPHTVYASVACKPLATVLHAFPAKLLSAHGAVLVAELPHTVYAWRGEAWLEAGAD